MNPEKKKKEDRVEDLTSEEYSILDDTQAVNEIYDFRSLELKLQEKEEFLGFRKRWSKYLLTLVVFIVLFNALFLIAVGKSWLRFNDEWLVRIIVTGSFVEVLGLARIVVQFLFSNEKDKVEKPKE